MHEKTVQDYCRAIDKMDGGEGVRSVDIARALSLSRNTVALTLRKLASEGFVEMERYGKVRLAKKGAAVARMMNFKHRVIETFLVSKLGIDKSLVHGEACAMEHSMSDDTARRLYAFIGRPKTDPHGRAIS
jgi:DtxR family Mn-dependent transcriptional regulator